MNTPILKEDETEKLLDKYYADRGWDNQSVPTKARLKKLGLEFVNV